MGMEPKSEVFTEEQTLVEALIDRQNDTGLMHAIAEWCNGVLVDTDKMRKSIIELRSTVRVYL